MKKLDLAQHFKVSSAQIDALLTAAGSATNLEDYNDEHLKAVETIQALVETKQANSVKAAGELYRKPLNEAQLHEIAMRHSIGDERIPAILSALKLKAENLTEDQFAVFQNVCQQLQQGMDLNMVAQAELEKAKSSKSKKTSAQAESTSSIAQTNGHLNAAAVVGVRSFPKETGGDLLETAGNEVSLDQTALIETATEGIFDASDQSRQQAYQYGQSLYYEALSTVMADEATIEANKAVIEEVKKRRRPARYS